MYARIKGIPIVKENWLVDCVAAHRLMPFEAPHLEEGQGSDGHQAFQGLRLHLAGAPDWLSRLIQHAGMCPSCSVIHCQKPLFLQVST